MPPKESSKRTEPFEGDASRLKPLDFSAVKAVGISDSELKYRQKQIAQIAENQVVSIEAMFAEGVLFNTDEEVVNIGKEMDVEMFLDGHYHSENSDKVVNIGEDLSVDDYRARINSDGDVFTSTPDTEVIDVGTRMTVEEYLMKTTHSKEVREIGEPKAID
ncbi:MAG: hypothetical protein ACFHVJ_00495 [Aestuariibacter sp.]